jgi:glutamate N-acetyltransferase/amino-acid N-acetyltransferase
VSDSVLPKPASARLNRKDLTLIELAPGVRWPGCSPRTAFVPRRCRSVQGHLSAGNEIRALVINTGIANAGTGEPGLARLLNRPAKPSPAMLGIQATRYCRSPPASFSNRCRSSADCRAAGVPRDALKADGWYEAATAS